MVIIYCWSQVFTYLFSLALKNPYYQPGNRNVIYCMSHRYLFTYFGPSKLYFEVYLRDTMNTIDIIIIITILLLCPPLQVESTAVVPTKQALICRSVFPLPSRPIKNAGSLRRWVVRVVILEACRLAARPGHRRCARRRLRRFPVAQGFGGPLAADEGGRAAAATFFYFFLFLFWHVERQGSRDLSLHIFYRAYIDTCRLFLCLVVCIYLQGSINVYFFFVQGLHIFVQSLYNLLGFLFFCFFFVFFCTG